MLQFCYDSVFQKKTLTFEQQLDVINKILFFNIYLFKLRLCAIVIVAKERDEYDIFTQK